MHPWIGAGQEDRRRILATLGKPDIDALFAPIPTAVKVDRLDLPDAKDEESVTSQERI